MFSRTLPEREYRAGLYEIIKCGVIRDAELFGVLDQCARDACSRRSRPRVERIIAAAVRIKAEVVTADEREGDLRRILNFGHTFGHALEAETHYAAIPARRSGRVRNARRHRPRGSDRTVWPPPDAARIHQRDRQVRADSFARRNRRRKSGRATAQRQEDHPGQGPFRAAGEDRRGRHRFRRRRSVWSWNRFEAALRMTGNHVRKATASEQAASRWVRGMFGRIAAAL